MSERKRLCLMCGKRPIRNSDYFCSMLCADAAYNCVEGQAKCAAQVAGRNQELGQQLRAEQAAHAETRRERDDAATKLGEQIIAHAETRSENESLNSKVDEISVHMEAQAEQIVRLTALLMPPQPLHGEVLYVRCTVCGGVVEWRGEEPMDRVGHFPECRLAAILFATQPADPPSEAADG